MTGEDVLLHDLKSATEPALAAVMAALSQSQQSAVIGAVMKGAALELRVRTGDPMLVSVWVATETSATLLASLP